MRRITKTSSPAGYIARRIMTAPSLRAEFTIQRRPPPCTPPPPNTPSPPLNLRLDSGLDFMGRKKIIWIGGG